MKQLERMQNYCFVLFASDKRKNSDYDFVIMMCRDGVLIFVILVYTVNIIERIVLERYLTDGVHIAMAIANGLDMILSLNFKHIVKKKTIEIAELVNVREGYRNEHIYTPMEVVENE